MEDFERDLFRGFKALSDEMESLINDFLKRPMLITRTRVWKPATDLYETDEEYVVRMDLAGIKREDVSIAYNGRVLAVRGVRREGLPHLRRNYHKMEIDFGPFERRIELPGPIDQAGIKATYRDGFLEIRFRKAVEKRDRSVIVVVE